MKMWTVNGYDNVATKYYSGRIQDLLIQDQTPKLLLWMDLNSLHCITT